MAPRTMEDEASKKLYGSAGASSGDSISRCGQTHMIQSLPCVGAACDAAVADALDSPGHFTEAHGMSEALTLATTTMTQLGHSTGRCGLTNAIPSISCVGTSCGSGFGVCQGGVIEWQRGVAG